MPQIPIGIIIPPARGIMNPRWEYWRLAETARIVNTPNPPRNIISGTVKMAPQTKK
jgi:hypothetical protein